MAKLAGFHNKYHLPPPRLPIRIHWRVTKSPPSPQSVIRGWQKSASVTTAKERARESFAGSTGVG